MSLWTITLLLGYSAVVALNLIFSFSLTTALNLLICFAVVMLPAGIIFFIGRLLPKEWFDENKFPFTVGKFKQKVCKITKVKTWKDKIPIGNRTLKSVAKPKDEDFLDTFIFQSCFADWLHTTVCYWGVVACVIIALVDKTLFWPMVFPITMLFIYQNMTSVIIQWFMRPRMIRYKTLLKEREERRRENELVQV